jgi:hypothetical protein
MLRIAGWVVLIALLLGPMASGQSSEEFVETVKVEDSKGVVTFATGFGKAFGNDYLSAYRGDSNVEIPFDRISTMRTGRVIDSRMDVAVVLTGGRGLEVQLDRPEFESVYGGLTEFGNFRIRLAEVRSLEFRRLEKYDEKHGQRCGGGHIWYKETWRYCPFDGKALAPLKPPVPGSEEPRPR